MVLGEMTVIQVKTVVQLIGLCHDYFAVLINGLKLYKMSGFKELVKGIEGCSILLSLVCKSKVTLKEKLKKIKFVAFGHVPPRMLPPSCLVC